ncbi:MAG: hypothetical protein ACFFHV_21600, partial [Promethearchaeota archaeon]
QKVYILDSIAYYSFSRIYRKLKVLKKWGPLINEAIDELKKRENEYLSKGSYIQIKKCLEYLNQTISASLYFIEVINDEKLKFKPIISK